MSIETTPLPQVKRFHLLLLEDIADEFNELSLHHEITGVSYIDGAWCIFYKPRSGNILLEL